MTGGAERDARGRALATEDDHDAGVVAEPRGLHLDSAVGDLEGEAAAGSALRDALLDEPDVRGRQAPGAPALHDETLRAEREHGTALRARCAEELLEQTTGRRTLDLEQVLLELRRDGLHDRPEQAAALGHLAGDRDDGEHLPGHRMPHRRTGAQRRGVELGEVLAARDLQALPSRGDRAHAVRCPADRGAPPRCGRATSAAGSCRGHPRAGVPVPCRPGRRTRVRAAPGTCRGCGRQGALRRPGGRRGCWRARRGHPSTAARTSAARRSPPRPSRHGTGTRPWPSSPAHHRSVA